MTHSRIFAFGLLVLSHLPAQGSPTSPVPLPVSSHSRAVPLVPKNGSGLAGVTRVITGDFTGEKRCHAVVLAQGIPYLVYGVPTHTWVQVLAPVVASDVAWLPADAVRPLDAVLGADSKGLWIAQALTPTTFSIVRAGSVAWSGVSRLWTRPKADGSTQVIGLLGTSTLLFATCVGTTVTQHATVVRSNPVFDVCPLLWNGNDDRAAIVESTGMSVWNTVSGALMRQSLFAANSGWVARLTRVANNDLLVWVRPASTGGYELLTTDAATSLSVPQSLVFPLGGSSGIAVTPKGFAGGDCNGDGRADLVFNVAEANQVLILPQQAAAPLLASSSFVALSMPEDELSAPLTAPPACADIDRDGIADVLAHDIEAGTLQLFGGLYWLLPAFLPPPDPAALIRPFQMYSLQTATSGKLSLALRNIPIEYLLYFGHLQVMLWRQPGPNAGVETSSVGNEAIKLVVTGNPSQLSRQWFEVQFDPGDYWPNHQHYYVEMRFVRLNSETTGNPVVVQASPSFVAALARPRAPNDPPYLTSGQGYMNYLASLPDSGPDVPTFEGLGVPTQGGRTRVGGIIPRRWWPQHGDAPAPQPLTNYFRQTLLW